MKKEQERGCRPCFRERVCRTRSGMKTGRRHVMLPKDIAKLVPKTHLMSESEWRNLGVQQSQGWVHYMIHEPEPHILLFRRPLPKKPKK
ncbi:cyclin-dependent kinases regulatory subunit 1 isoform X2 [Peromyscus leucopus]|uniref:cyclin-dependent kinases regulatory subunit 1 isoform X2 n=1 Tax=Peromyscus leucopus TaxID=10041 RepID=UPI001885276A|nr:cyclin-dependent kinases regulatory subunit 1 isoform X2 [Peromyscus leucopus]